MVACPTAAERLGVTQRQVRRFVEAGQLVAQQIGDYPNAPWVITEESLERLAATRAERPPRKGRRPAATERSSAEDQIPQIAEFAGRAAPAEASEAERAGVDRSPGRAAVGLASGDLALEVLREATRAIESLYDLAPSLGSREGRELVSRMKRVLQHLEERIP